jgi:hypothetical protein
VRISNCVHGNCIAFNKIRICYTHFLQSNQNEVKVQLFIITMKDKYSPTIYCHESFQVLSVLQLSHKHVCPPFCYQKLLAQRTVQYIPYFAKIGQIVKKNWKGDIETHFVHSHAPGCYCNYNYLTGIGRRRDRPWPNLGHYSKLCPDRLRTDTKISQDRASAGLGPPE